MEPTTSWALYAILVPSLCAFIVSVCVAVATKWAQVRFLMELEYRLADVEARVNREVKIRAGAKGTESRNQSDALVEWAKDNASQGNVGQGNFKDWYHGKMTGKTGA